MSVYPKYVQLRIGGGGVTPHVYVRTCTLYKLTFFMFLAACLTYSVLFCL